MPGTTDLLSYWATVLLQLLVATFCGGVIGYQREVLERPAGFRTHVLVCVGSAVYMIVSVAVAGAQFDPGRIAAQVASGIGFLGAGTIIKQGSIVRGLTTAASLWAVAGIGLAAGYGGGALAVALLGTLVVLASLTILKRVEWLIERGVACTISLTVERPGQRIDWMRQVLAAHGIELRALSFEEGAEGVGAISVDGRARSLADMEAAVGELSRGAGVHGIRWECQ